MSSPVKQKWAGKFVIGLTGNIGTGKSVVRRMLEHLGAYGIDADQLSHRVIARGAPGYQSIVARFGPEVVGADGEIDRTHLGRLVFSDPQALMDLEQIIHPLVEEAVVYMACRASQPVIVLEAIKLLESDLRGYCDSLWTTYAPPEVQLVRLMQYRKMTEADARQRITAQAPQEEKIAAVDVVIRNDSTLEDTWKQVAAAWEKTVPAARPTETRETPALRVQRGRPGNSGQMADFYRRVRPDFAPSPEEVTAAFGEQAFLLLQLGASLVGVLGYQVENLVARTLDLTLDPQVPAADALAVLTAEMERAVNQLQCEASLVFVSPELAQQETVWSALGYEPRLADTLGTAAWSEAAREAARPGCVMLFKQLRADRVLNPI